MRLKQFNLRFEDARDEASFKQHCEKELLISSCIMCIVAFAVTMIYIVFFFYDETSQQASSPFSGEDSRTFTFGCWLLMATIAALYAIMSTLRMWFGLFSSCAWEEFFIVTTVGFAVSFVLGNRWHAPLLFGENPDFTWSSDPRQSAVHVPLSLDIGLTIICLYFPVRSSVVCVLPACSVGVFSVLQLSFPAAFPGGAADVVIIVALALFALHGAWKNENQRRYQWTVLRKAEQAEATVLELKEQQEGHIDEINNLREEIKVATAEVMDVVVPLPMPLPGSVAVPQPHGGGSRGRSQQGTSPDLQKQALGQQSLLPPQQQLGSPWFFRNPQERDQDSYVSSFETTDSTEGSGDLDGIWVLDTMSPDVASWLHLLTINGDDVTDGDGKTVKLKLVHGYKFLEGGRLVAYGDTLFREGKKSRLTFTRKEPLARAPSQKNSASSPTGGVATAAAAAAAACGIPATTGCAETIEVD